jgi:two-component system, OmpR family, response regulator
MTIPATPPLAILVVEDNDELREALVDALSTKGYHARGIECAELIPEQGDFPLVDLFIIDLNLPGEDGLSLAKRMRAVHPDIGIIMLTARSRMEDKCDGYASGADLYMTKPASLEELVAAIQALSRRLRRVHESGFSLDIRQLCLCGPNGQTLSINAQEGVLLAAFIRAPQQRLENWQIAELLGMSLDTLSKPALELHLVRLRKKLRSCGGNASPIKVIRGWGYQLCLDIRLV